MRAKSKLIGILILVMFVQLSADAQHENQAYLPLTKAEIRKKFPVKYVGTLGYERPGYFEGMVDKPFPGKLDIGPSGAVVIEGNDNDLIIAGKDRRNHDWSIEPGELVFSYACRFYEADLDRSGTRDALLVFPTGGNGLAPTSHQLAITFDERGRPVTFEVDGYFQEVDGKIFDLVDLDQDGRAELIYMNFSDGYWITSLYEVRNGRWRKIHGRHGRRVYPLYTRFTFRENHKSTAPKPGRHPFAPDLSNTSPRLVGKLVSYEWANVARSEDILLRVTDKRGNAVSSKPQSWSATFAVVVDNNNGRKILFLSAKSDSVKSLLNEIVANRYEIALYGQRGLHTSSPEILWARPKGQH